MGKLDNLNLEDIADVAKLANVANIGKLVNEHILKKEIEEIEEEKKTNVLVWVLAIIGVMVVAAGIVFAVYRYLKPAYLDDFDDDFEDNFDDTDEEDFFADDEKEKA